MILQLARLKPLRPPDVEVVAGIVTAGVVAGEIASVELVCLGVVASIAKVEVVFANAETCVAELICPSLIFARSPQVAPTGQHPEMSLTTWQVVFPGQQPPTGQLI